MRAPEDKDVEAGQVAEGDQLKGGTGGGLPLHSTLSLRLGGLTRLPRASLCFASPDRPCEPGQPMVR